MLALPDQHPTYLIIDALDESPSTSGVPSPRETVLQLLEELVDLSLADLRMCHEPPRNRYTECARTLDLSPSVSSRPKWTKARHRGLC